MTWICAKHRDNLDIGHCAVCRREAVVIAVSIGTILAVSILTGCFG